MTYNEKKSLYESIMKDIAKMVKRRLNENNEKNKLYNDGWFVGFMTDENDDKIIFAIKGKTYDETMKYTSAFVFST